MAFQAMKNCDCGARPKLCKREGYSNYLETLYPDEVRFTVQCAACGTAGRSYDTQHEAVNSWNEGNRYAAS